MATYAAAAAADADADDGAPEDYYYYFYHYIHGLYIKYYLPECSFLQRVRTGDLSKQYIAS